MSGFNHLRGDGSAHMVDVSAKQVSTRTATAVGRVTCAASTVASLRDGSVPKGDVLAVARIAGIAATKRTPELLPLAHVIGVHGCELDLELVDDGVLISATVHASDRTGVEMEALTAVSVAALAIVDMIKGVDRSAAIRDCMIIAKSGGRSGDWRRPLAELPGWAFED